MRNMIQLLGGVAVAGAVAAGSTAFTASGLTVNGGANTLVGGGTTAVTVNGARLMKSNFTADPANPDHITGLTITIDGGSGVTLASTSNVKVKFAGTAVGTGVTASGTYFSCSLSSGQDWTCTIAGSGTYYSDVTGVDVSVAPVTA